MIDYCVSRSLDTIIEYVEEPRSSFLARLQEAATKTNLGRESIIRRLKAIQMPESLQLPILGSELEIDQLISRIIDWEEIRKN